jgi:hypothetical protein
MFVRPGVDEEDSVLGYNEELHSQIAEYFLGKWAGTHRYSAVGPMVRSRAHLTHYALFTHAQTRFMQGEESLTQTRVARTARQ